MTNVFITILNMSITAGVVVIAVLPARVVLRKAPKIFSYVLWSAVLFRLVFPFSIESIFSLMPARPAAISQDIIFSSYPAVQTGIPFFDMPINAAIVHALPLVNPADSIQPIHALLGVAGYVWLVGFLALLVYAVIGYVGLKRRIRYATRVQGNIFETDKIKTPFVLGFIRPKIYFPLNIDPLQQDYILLHEQTHIKRLDYLIKPFAFVLLALHWFNPLVWIAYFLMLKDMEMSCDEAVLHKTSEDIRGVYSSSLLNLAVKRVGLLNPLAFGESSVKERVVNVLSFKKPKARVFIVSLIAASLFLVGFVSDRVMAVSNLIPPELAVYELSQLRTERPANTISPEEAADIAARYIWDNFGVDIDGSVVHMTYQYVQTRMRTHADDDVMVGVWAFMVGERGVLTGVNMEFTFRGMINALTGEVIAVFPAGVDEIMGIVPFRQSFTQPPVGGNFNFVPPPAFPETRQMLLTAGLYGMTSGAVFAYYYCPQTRTIWITNTGEYRDALLNHVNIRCADTGEVLTIPMVYTQDGVPKLAFFVETTDTGSPRLLAVDSVSRPNVVTAIGLSPRTPPPLGATATTPPPPHIITENDVLVARSSTHASHVTPELLEAVTVRTPLPLIGDIDPLWHVLLIDLYDLNDFDLMVTYWRWLTLFEGEFGRPDITQIFWEEAQRRNLRYVF